LRWFEDHSVVPLLSSLVVALGGLLLGWLVYRKVKTSAEMDPLEKGLGGVYRFVQKKYLVDELYELVFIRPANWFADVFVSQWMDQIVLDGIINGIGKLGLMIGRGLRYGFDLPVVNGAADGVATGTRNLGGLLRKVQTGKVQQYLAGSVTGLVVLVIGYHHACGSLLKKFERGANTRSHTWYRWFNEVPVLLLLAIVVLVVVKPF